MARPTSQDYGSPREDPEAGAARRWDGDELVVERNGFRDDVWLDVNGSPMTSAGKMTERWRRLKFGLMQVDITIDDPKAYTKPFTVRVNHQLMPDTDLMEFVCEERDAVHYFGKQDKEGKK